MSQSSPASHPSLSAFAQHHPDPILEVSGQGVLVYFNQAANDLAKSLGRPDVASFLPAEAPALIQACLAGGQDKSSVESTLSGRTFAWSFFPAPLKASVLCHVTEVTDRQLLESQLRHSQKLEALGRMAAAVAHDFNNILTVIQGHVGLLQSVAPAQPAMAESLQQVHRATERAGKLTSQLLAFSRKTEMNPKRVDLNEVLTGLSTIFHRTLGEDIDYRFSYAAGLPSLYADVGMMEQLIMSLAVNARDAMPRGGQLLIGTSVAEVDQAHAAHHAGARIGRFVCLSFVDSGCGMDEVTRGRIFEPFFTTKELGKGTGLGLSVVEGIVKKHQGWIEVQSTLGQGTSFRVYLPPCTDEQAARSAEPPGPDVPGGRETILVVEDEPPVRWVLRNILERLGYHVLEAGSGVEALAVWHQHHQEVALLLTDMVMPVGLNGQELAVKFRSQKRNLKVIYTSGYSAEAAGGDMSLTDGVDFLQKPFDAVKLAAAIRRRLDG